MNSENYVWFCQFCDRSYIGDCPEECECGSIDFDPIPIDYNGPGAVGCKSCGSHKPEVDCHCDCHDQ